MGSKQRIGAMDSLDFRPLTEKRPAVSPSTSSSSSHFDVGLLLSSWHLCALAAAACVCVGGGGGEVYQRFEHLQPPASAGRQFHSAMGRWRRFNWRWAVCSLGDGRLELCGCRVELLGAGMKLDLMTACPRWRLKKVVSLACSVRATTEAATGAVCTWRRRWRSVDGGYLFHI